MRVEQSALSAAALQLDPPPPWRDPREREAAAPTLPNPAATADNLVCYPAPPAPWPRVFPGL